MFGKCKAYDWVPETWIIAAQVLVRDVLLLLLAPDQRHCINMGFSSANTNFEMAKWPDVMQIYIFFSPDRLGVSTQEQLCPHLKLIVHMKTKTTVHLESNIGIVSLGCSAGTQHQIPNFIPCDSFALFLSVRWGEARRPFSRKLALLSSFSCVSEKETMASRISTSS